MPETLSQRATKVSHFLGLRKNDKILKINSKPPKNVNDAVSFIKKVGFALQLPIKDTFCAHFIFRPGRGLCSKWREQRMEKMHQGI